MGGVLIRIASTWSAALARARLPVPQHIGPDTKLTDLAEFQSYQAGELSDGQYYAILAVYLQVSPSDAERVHESILIEPYPGVHELVDELKAAGVVTGCLSNTNAPHWQAMNESGRFPANQVLDVRLASHLLGVEKPAEAAFRAFEEASLCQSEDILLFDDSEPNVIAAKAIGWQVQLIDPHPETSLQMRRKLDDLGWLLGSRSAG